MVRSYFDRAIQQCNLRCLLISSNWLAEQLIGIDDNEEEGDKEGQGGDDEHMHAQADKDAAAADSSVFMGFSEDIYEIEGINRYEKSRILLAQSLLYKREYQRCTHMLSSYKKCNEVKLSSQRGDLSVLYIFLTAYSKYMAGEKLRDQLAPEKSTDTSGKSDKKVPSPPVPDIAQGVSGLGNNCNTHLREVFYDLLPLYINTLESNTSTMSEVGGEGEGGGNKIVMDGFLMYLFAVVIKQLDRLDGEAQLSEKEKEMILSKKKLYANTNSNGVELGNSSGRILDSRQLLLESIRMYPWNW